MTRADLQKKDICAVFVTYHPDAAFPERMARVLNQTGHVVLVDNGSETVAAAMLQELVATYGVQLVANRDNLGVATAVNQGIDAAQAAGFSWVLCFDQDSKVFPGMVDELIRVHRSIPGETKIAAIGVNSVDPHTGIPFLRRCQPSPAGFVPRTTVITSGSLVPVDVARSLGGFRGDFFVDHVDHEYCLKARRNGYSIFSTTTPLMEHSIGSYEIHSLLGIKVLCLNHSPLRWYYITRNFVVLVKEYWRREPVWLVITGLYFLAFMGGVCLFEAERRRKAIRVWQGLVDGVRGKLGPWNESHNHNQC